MTRFTQVLILPEEPGAAEDASPLMFRLRLLESGAQELGTEGVEVQAAVGLGVSIGGSSGLRRSQTSILELGVGDILGCHASLKCLLTSLDMSAADLGYGQHAWASGSS